MAETERFNEVIQTAAHLFNNKGFKNTSMHDIAKALGIYKASLYHHVSGKQEILFHALKNSLGALQKALDPVLDNVDKYQFEELLTRAIAAHLKGNYSNPSSRINFQIQLKYLSDDYRQKIQDQLNRYLQSWLIIFNKGEEQGILELAVSPKIYIYFLQVTANNAYEWYRRSGPLSMDEIAEFICKLFLYGMAKPAMKPLA